MDIRDRKTCSFPAVRGSIAPPAIFFIDPVRNVDRALITHGHADHARAGHGHVLATAQTLDIMAIPLSGADHAGATQSAGLGEEIRIKDVTVTFHPAGQCARLGADCRGAQNGLRIVASGDYKPRPDPTCATSSRSLVMSSSPRRPSPCRCSAIPMPWLKSASCCGLSGANPDRAHLVGVYSLGKAQRVIRLIRDGRI